jgi:hypothetical protein
VGRAGEPNRPTIAEADVGKASLAMARTASVPAPGSVGVVISAGIAAINVTVVVNSARYPHDTHAIRARALHHLDFYVSRGHGWLLFRLTPASEHEPLGCGATPQQSAIQLAQGWTVTGMLDQPEGRNRS